LPGPGGPEASNRAIIGTGGDAARSPSPVPVDWIPLRPR
jgi:hypothetical protein